ncbi:acetoin utilization protein AcuC [Cellulomonas sp. HZM]|uniref:acetoin utilization protein AcuC n=1 Tax=Cellulomonas sp. HZM TaxID=1454010 RepID=UPI0009DF567D|nr:acetoin utilization protein AcuC [Cellulomonas sp. HZM]
MAAEPEGRDEDDVVVHVAWAPDVLDYDFGAGHPMSPERLDLTFRLAQSLGVLDGVDLVPPAVASDALLRTVHEAEYVAAVREAGAHGTPDPERGLGTSDDPVFPAMHEASARAVGGSVEAALAVWSGRARHGVNVGGGLHHAMPGAASGFCVYNDAAVAIRALLDAGARRVAYVDTDAHHGDGVQAVFWDDPRVLTISIHETGAALFPGTGFPGEVGGPAARGYAVNVALPSRTGDEGWLRAFDAVVPDALREFAPDVVVSQHGCDAHVLDPLTRLRISVDAQRLVAVRVHELAHEVSDGRWVALGGGGYAVVDVVPRAWTHLLAVALHRPVDPTTPVPRAWLDLVQQRHGRQGPSTMGDGVTPVLRPWSSGYDPGDEVDRAIRATRAAAFPYLGLDPEA